MYTNIIKELRLAKSNPIKLSGSYLIFNQSTRELSTIYDIKPTKFLLTYAVKSLDVYPNNDYHKYMLVYDEEYNSYRLRTKKDFTSQKIVILQATSDNKILAYGINLGVSLDSIIYNINEAVQDLIKDELPTHENKRDNERIRKLLFSLFKEDIRY